MYHLEFTRIDRNNNRQYETLCITVDSYMVKGRMHPRKEGRGPCYCAESIVIFKNDGFRKKGTSYFLKQEYSADHQTYERCLIKDERNNIIVCHSGFAGEAYSSMVDLLERVEKSGALDKISEEDQAEFNRQKDLPNHPDFANEINRLAKERQAEFDKPIRLPCSKHLYNYEESCIFCPSKVVEEKAGKSEVESKFNIDMNAEMDAIFEKRKAAYLAMKSQESNNENT